MYPDGTIVTVKGIDEPGTIVGIYSHFYIVYWPIPPFDHINHQPYPHTQVFFIKA